MVTVLAWTEQAKRRGLSEQPIDIRVVKKSCNIELINEIIWINVNHSSSTALKRGPHHYLMIVFYTGMSTPIDCQILQDDLNSLAKWEMDWQMKFNVSKCHSMRVTRLHPSRHIEFNYTLHQQTLEQVPSAKYLGLTITDDPDWGQHISEITCKATKTLGFLRRNLALAKAY